MSFYYDIYLELTERAFKKFNAWMKGEYKGVMDEYMINDPDNIYKKTFNSGTVVYAMQWLSYNKFELYHDTNVLIIQDVLEALFEYDEEDVDSDDIDEMYFCELFGECDIHEVMGSGQCDFCLLHEIDTENGAWESVDE